MPRAIIPTKMMNNESARSAWARAVTKVHSKQAGLQRRAKKAERDLAFSRIWGDPIPHRRSVAAVQAYAHVAASVMRGAQLV
jgi:hypothetical protein